MVDFSSIRPRAIAGSAAANACSASGADVSISVPDARTKRSDSSVRYAFCSVPQHIPDELFATMPPIMQAPIDAGSGPSFAPWRARWALTIPPTTPGPTRTRVPPSKTSSVRQCFDTSTMTPDPTAWPDSDVPAARNVSGTRDLRLHAQRALISLVSCGRTTACGISV